MQILELTEAELTCTSLTLTDSNLPAPDYLARSLKRIGCTADAD